MPETTPIRAVGGSPRRHSRSSRGRNVLSNEQLAEYIKKNSLIDVGIGGGAAVWTVSSAKHGNGVVHLINYHDRSTFWQSDGGLPHTVTVQFARLTQIEAVCVYLNHTRDESYTPMRIKVCAGTHEGDMTEVSVVDVDQPVGWVLLELGERVSDDQHIAIVDADCASAWIAEDDMDACEHVWVTTLEVVFVQNHHSGRDCHVRGMRILGPCVKSIVKETSITQHMLLR